MSEFMQGILVGAALVTGAAVLGRWLVTPAPRREPTPPPAPSEKTR